MTKIKVTDAAKQLGAGAKELLDKISGTRKGNGDTLAALRKLEEKLAAQEMKAKEEADRAREENERKQAEADRIAAANAQEEALRAAVIAERDRARRENEPAQAPAPAAEAPVAQEKPAQAAPKAEQPQQRPQQQGERRPFNRENNPQGDRRGQQQGNRPQRPGFTPRPFVPNPNDPNALVNRQNPNFVPPQGQQAPQQGERRPFNRDGQQGERRPFNRDGQGQQGERRPFNRDGQGQQGNRPFQPRGDRPFVPRDKDKDADTPQQRRPQQRPASRPKAPDMLPVMEKERVSNYDPNKNNYNRQHDPEKKAQKPKKQIMKENVRAAGGLDDEWRRSKKPKKSQMAAVKPEPVKIEKAFMTAEKITVKDLSERIGKPVAEIIKKLLLLGIMATINQELDYDTALLVCSEFGIELEIKMEKTSEEALLEENVEVDSEDDLLPRPSSPSWVTLTTARPRCWTASAEPTLRRAKRAASRSTSARTPPRSTISRSRSWILPVTKRSPPCVCAARSAPILWFWWSLPTTASCPRPWKPSTTPRPRACRSSSPSTRWISPPPTPTVSSRS